MSVIYDEEELLLNMEEVDRFIDELDDEAYEKYSKYENQVSDFTDILANAYNDTLEWVQTEYLELLPPEERDDFEEIVKKGLVANVYFDNIESYLDMEGVELE